MTDAREGFYQLPLERAFEALQSDQGGLSSREAQKRLKRYGLNRLKPKQRVSVWKVYFSQFQNSLIIILLAAAGLTFFVWFFGAREQSDLIEGALILAIVMLITILGFFQEWKAERAIEALKKLMAFQAKVLRDGQERIIDVGQIVPGDVMVLEEGIKVPADMRMIESSSLYVNEASLTGESAPVAKKIEAVGGKVQIADQVNMLFAGTAVTQGRGLAMVTATGDATEIGKIATLVAETEEDVTPLQKRLDHVGKVLGNTVLAIAVVVFVFIVFFADNYAGLSLWERVLHSFIAAVALAVAAIPEGLPAVVTISLALGTQRMLKRKALVRKLNSIETLGSTDVICSDKTGTLTKGEMTVTDIYFDGIGYTVSGTGYATDGAFAQDGKTIDAKILEIVLKIGVLCNNARLDAKSIMGDPTEAALLVSGAKAGLSYRAKRLKEIPFSSGRKMMSVLVEEADKATVYAKGAPEIILKHCTKIWADGQVHPLTAERRQTVLDQTQAMAQRALRTLAFASREAKTTEAHDLSWEHDLVFWGLQGMIDPPRQEVKNLISQCHDSGIRIIMLTGDHAATAEAVAEQIGISGGTIQGDDIDNLSAVELRKVVERINIYARINPGTKMRIVEALKRDRHTVAMTGDGVNDAPALKKADIGIAMGITGTDVAKEASDMVILDDRFATLVSAVEEGRGVFDNIGKFVNYLLSCNIAEVLVVFLIIMLFRDLPLTATMLLWINVVTDGLPAVALGMDPAERGIMRYAPKKFQGEIITARLWLEMVLAGLVITAGVVWIYWVNLPEGLSEARAAAFVAIVVFEIMRLFAIRFRYKIGFFSNGWLIAAAALSIVLQLLIVYIPFFGRLFDVTGIDSHDWLLIGVFSLVILALGWDWKGPWRTVVAWLSPTPSGKIVSG